jgi:hypothetical protein
MNEIEFRDHVIDFLRSEYSDVVFEPGVDPRVIRMGDVELGLQNLYSTYRVNAIPSVELRDRYRHHFSEIMKRIAADRDYENPPWQEANTLLRPQLMPQEYCEQSPVANSSFCEGVAIGIVLDREERYRFVREEDLESWDKTFSDVYERALENLELASSGIPMQSTDGPDRFIGIETKDGFDAARILLPQLREFICQHLGEPFLAGVPNRDFLICWSSDCSQEFQNFAADKIENDFQNQPYELTPMVLKVTKHSIEPA